MRLRLPPSWVPVAESAEGVGSVAAALEGDPLGWCLRPTLGELLTPGAPRRHLLRDAQHAVTAAARTATGRGLRLRWVGTTAFACVTDNHRRTLAPIADALMLGGMGPPVPPSVAPRATAVVPGLRAAATTLDRLHDAARAAGLLLDGDAAAHQLLQAAQVRFLYQRELERRRARAVVVSTQHMVVVRALLVAARAAGVPSVYVPHAPAADVAHYRDLPFDLAALRGERERDFYLGLGATPDGVTVIGNPGLPPRSAPAPVLDGPAVLAVSPHPPDVLAQLVDLVRSVLPDGVVLAPHPRSDLAQLESIRPEGWRLHRGSTDALLESVRPWCLLQHLSGVSWESLSRGIPTIELVFPGRPIAYLHSRPPHVPRASTTLELRDALAAATAVDRTELVAWADAWCDRTGPSAAEAGARAVEAARPLPEVVLDGWAR